MTRRSRPPTGPAPKTSAKKSTVQSTGRVRQRGGPWEYSCSAGHHLVSPWPIDCCLAFRFGRPCEGTLRRVGPGSRSTR